jgi:hypothetical protein
MHKKYSFLFPLVIVSIVFFFGILLLDRYGIDTSAVLSGSAIENLSCFAYDAKENETVQEKEVENGIVKSIYLTSYSASSKAKINYALNIIDNTEINSVVIDIKDFSGYVFYDSSIEEVEKYGAENIRIRDIDSLIEDFHKRGVYVIARVAVFQDPVLTNARRDLAITKKDELFLPPFVGQLKLWLDNLNLAWVDPASEESWDYNISIAKEAFEKGFDEVNFDYVRFPSDGNLSDMQFPIWDGKTPRSEVLRNFFEKVRESMPDKKISVDLFGLTTTNYDDLGVGQIIEYAYENFDYVCPMVYPSHYAKGFLGYTNPAQYPYEVVKYSMDRARERLALYKSVYETEDKEITCQLRPWIQDFDMGAVYNSQMVKSEIQAVYDALGSEANGYMMWNPSNIYTTEAVKF